jgi:hypothetical protein
MKQSLAILSCCVAAAAELPVKTVILYKHGVGYFERSGDLRAGESARLDFEADAMNDVLKSLTVEDSTRKVVALRYDSSLPLERKLGEYPFKLGEQLSLTGFLDQIKGARVALRTGSEMLKGAIVSGRSETGGERQPMRELLVLLVDSGDLRTVDLSSVASVKLEDPALQAQLREYLGAVSLARSKEKKSVYIDSADTPSRRVTAGYMIPTPVWKSSYRLVLREQGEPTLEGWAIVDNTTSEDWTGVRLSLVSGRPVSFISKLYEPKYLVRQVAELPDEGAAGPVVHEGGVLRAQAVPPLPVKSAPAAPRPRAMAELALADEERSLRKEMTSTVAVDTQGRELGDLFEYRFGTPVTVKKNESAMLPFIQQKTGARKLLIYTGSGVHPMNAAEITNSTGQTLDGGPITVYDGGAYAGEALVETLKANDKRLISYAVDLGTRITTLFDSNREVVREIRARRGVLETRNAVQETRTYTARNVDNKAKTLIIEHPARPGYTLLNQKPSETTTSAWRFEVKLPAGASEKFAVNEERVYNQTYLVTNLTPDVLVTWVQNKALSDAGRAQLQRILDHKRQIAAADTALKTMQTQIDELVRDQGRIRENIASLNRVSGQQEQVQKYSRELAAQEAQLASLRDQQSELRKKKAALESELGAMIEKLEF